MTTVFLTSASVSPFSRPGNFTDAGHTVEEVGAGGNGGAGFTGANAVGRCAGGGGAYIKLTTPVGTLGSTTAFQVLAFNSNLTNLNDPSTLWENSTATNCYMARSGTLGDTGGSGDLGAGGDSTVNTLGTPSPVTYTISVHNNGGVGGGVQPGAFLGGNGGGGSAGPDGIGQNGQTNTGTGPKGGCGGGGANGGSSTAGAVASTLTGGGGGDGNAGTGHGTGSSSTTSPNGSAATSGTGAGAGAGAGSSVSTVGQIVSGYSGGDLGNAVDWVQTSDSTQAGAGGGGGGAGSCSGNVAVTSNPGNGANFGGGAGSGGGCRGVGSTMGGGTGGGGLIVVIFTPVPAPPTRRPVRNLYFKRMR